MNSPEQLKQLLKPTQVVQYYLGTPIKRNKTGDWYKSPFRAERTASFLVSDTKGIHDFGTSEHYDIISFLQELFRIDFKTAINKLHYDFKIDTENRFSRELEVYISKRRQEEIKIKKEIDKWFNETFIKMCTELKLIQNATPNIQDIGLLAHLYYREVHLENYIEDFVVATDEDKVDLWKDKKSIEKWI